MTHGLCTSVSHYFLKKMYGDDGRFVILEANCSAKSLFCFKLVIIQIICLPCNPYSCKSVVK